MKYLKYFREQVKPIAPADATDTDYPEQAERSRRAQENMARIAKSCPEGIDEERWLELEEEEREGVLTRKKIYEEAEKKQKGKGLESLIKYWNEQDNVTGSSVGVFFSTRTTGKVSRAIREKHLSSMVRPWIFPLSEDPEGDVHTFLSYTSLISSFLGPWGLAASTVLSAVDAGLYFKQGNNAMGWLMIIMSCIPALKWGKALNIGSKTLGGKGLVELFKKFTFAGGKFSLKSGVKLSFQEKVFVLAILKNMKLILTEAANNPVIRAVGPTVREKLSQAAGAFVFYISYKEFLVDDEMTEEEKKEAMKTIDESRKGLKRNPDGTNDYQMNWEDNESDTIPYEYGD